MKKLMDGTVWPFIAPLGERGQGCTSLYMPAGIPAVEAQAAARQGPARGAFKAHSWGRQQVVHTKGHLD